MSVNPSESVDSAISQNPYAANARPPDAPPAVSELPALPMTAGIGCAVGVFYGAFFAALLGLGLSIFVLVPPMNHWFDLDGEFDGLLMIVMPLFSAGCGSLCGLTFASVGGKPKRLLTSILLAAFLSVGLTVVGALGNWHKLATLVMGCVLFGATTGSTVLLSVIFRYIENRRARVQWRRKQDQDYGCPRWLALIAWISTGFAGLTLLPLFSNRGSLAESLWLTFCATTGLMLLSSFIVAVYPFDRSLKWMLRSTVAIAGMVMLKLGSQLL